MTDTALRHVPERRRYEYVVDEVPLAIAEYRLEGDVAVMHHTYTDPRYRGRGFAAREVAGALEDLRDRGLRVRPQCWFVADFVASHPEYRDLVASP